MTWGLISYNFPLFVSMFAEPIKCSTGKSMSLNSNTNREENFCFIFGGIYGALSRGDIGITNRWRLGKFVEMHEVWCMNGSMDNIGIFVTP